MKEPKHLKDTHWQHLWLNLWWNQLTRYNWLHPLIHFHLLILLRLDICICIMAALCHGDLSEWHTQYELCVIKYITITRSSWCNGWFFCWLCRISCWSSCITKNTRCSDGYLWIISVIAFYQDIKYISYHPLNLESLPLWNQELQMCSQDQLNNQ